ncbi:hypothetical protein [Sphingobacterium sp. JB170]|uniref:hypothetical protein n=1 Tax=Sphingobacterium sp. JB170 TaxID=1434842 RepID=UPI00097EDFDA|nr:hypothetical protein [Sphingobacterium sp. JB170]SJN49834.1 hypothetical protein FM107_19300 [Sphingobacterium sp. JB170]
MKNLNRLTVTQNILKLIDQSGITDVEFANLLEKSVRTIKRIREQQSLFTVDDINKSASFFQIDIRKMNNSKIKFEDNFRHNLLAKHKHHTAYSPLLEKKPSISYAIRYYLLKEQKFKIGLTVHEIKEYFSVLKWDYSSSYISTAMVRNNDLIEISQTKIVNGKKINVYRKK